MTFEKSADSLERLVIVARHIFTQALEFVDLLESDEQLTGDSNYLPGSTIGKHLRHARDHYTLLLDALESTPPRVVNYDIRLRNTPMESNRVAAKEALKETLGRLEKLVPNQALVDEILTLNAVTPYPQVFETTFGRELWFCELHAIHHWSMIRVIAGELDVKITDESFGFAPSTLVFKGSDVALGQSKY
ncbi:hypothetical protein BDM02DRAFT_3129705 [Thelephora ganbajun]|uniref:Uncharacterized protein n=1 Tax=Thelephora ganbajun TaxID=370292 RepID=A0ACB6ZDK2_THEGA|nr:hypothetical protein BDM02DRAFT_3129705 [Thelephora ganbajun]